MGGAVCIPEEVAAVLEREARRRGLSLLEFLLSCVADRLDPRSRVELYVGLHGRYLREARELAEERDLMQASEKYWGAVTALLSAIGEREDLPHYSHRDLKEITIYLTEKEGDPEYSRLFSSTETLHANSHHNFLKEKSFQAHREDTEKLIAKLRKYLGLK